MWATPATGNPQSSQVQEHVGNAPGKSIFLVLKCFLALDGPAGGLDTTFVKVPPGLRLLPLAPAPTSLRLTRKTVVGEATDRRTETEDEERVGHLAPRGGAGGPPAVVAVTCPGHQRKDLPALAGAGGGGERRLQRRPEGAACSHVAFT